MKNPGGKNIKSVFPFWLLAPDSLSLYDLIGFKELNDNEDARGEYSHRRSRGLVPYM
jgi:hypothetical protein